MSKTKIKLSCLMFIEIFFGLIFYALLFLLPTGLCFLIFRKLLFLLKWEPERLASISSVQDMFEIFSIGRVVWYSFCFIFILTILVSIIRLPTCNFITEKIEKYKCPNCKKDKNDHINVDEFIKLPIKEYTYDKLRSEILTDMSTDSEILKLKEKLNDSSFLADDYLNNAYKDCYYIKCRCNKCGKEFGFIHKKRRIHK